MGKNNRFYYKGYTAEVEYDFEDKVFVGHLININDTVLFDTEDPNQVEAEFHKTIDEYIDACKDMGLEPDRLQSYPTIHIIRPTRSCHTGYNCVYYLSTDSIC